MIGTGVGAKDYFSSSDTIRRRGQIKEFSMADEDQFKGAAKDAGGSIKEGVGKMTGNERLEAEGKVDKVEGKTQKAVGDVKSDLK